MDKKTRPIYMLPPKDSLQIERYTKTKSKGMEKVISCEWKGKKARIAILILYFAMYNVLLCIMHTHDFGTNFQEKNFVLIF